MAELTGEHTAGFEGDRWSVNWYNDRIEICVKGEENDEHRIALDISGSSTIDKMLSEMYRKRMDVTSITMSQLEEMFAEYSPQWKDREKKFWMGSEKMFTDEKKEDVK